MRTRRLRCLIFDSYYDSYLGVVVTYPCVKDGTVKPGDSIKLMSTGAEFEVVEAGTLAPFGLQPTAEYLSAGDVGIFYGKHKDRFRDTRVGDTVTLSRRSGGRAAPRLPSGAVPMVYVGNISRRRREVQRPEGRA